jgi:3',5'-cyclic AMP phosphodiesterase CpdA
VTRIAHLSDLHMGTEAAGLPEALAEAIARLRPDLVVVSGDLTQRARAGQFRGARALLDRFGAPWLAVPGNHDVPLWNLPARHLRPFEGYRRHVAHDLAPRWRDAAVAVAGLNTVDPCAWEAGRFRQRDAGLLSEAFADAGDRLRVVAMHHPPIHPPDVRKRLMRGAGEALAGLAAAGADVVLCGHLHAWATAPITARKGGRELLMVQAGTALSTRRRGEANDFNLLTVDGTELAVERWAHESDGAFRCGETHRFRRVGEVWLRIDTAPAAAPARAAARVSARVSAALDD